MRQLILFVVIMLNGSLVLSQEMTYPLLNSKYQLKDFVLNQDNTIAYFVGDDHKTTEGNLLKVDMLSHEVEVEKSTKQYPFSVRLTKDGKYVIVDYLELHLGDMGDGIYDVYFNLLYQFPAKKKVFYLGGGRFLYTHEPWGSIVDGYEESTDTQYFIYNVQTGKPEEQGDLGEEILDVSMYEGCQYATTKATQYYYVHNMTEGYKTEIESVRGEPKENALMSFINDSLLFVNAYMGHGKHFLYQLENDTLKNIPVSKLIKEKDFIGQDCRSYQLLDYEDTSILLFYKKGMLEVFVVPFSAESSFFLVFERCGLKSKVKFYWASLFPDSEGFTKIELVNDPPGYKVSPHLYEE